MTPGSVFTVNSAPATDGPRLNAVSPPNSTSRTPTFASGWHGPTRSVMTGAVVKLAIHSHSHAVSGGSLHHHACHALHSEPAGGLQTACQCPFVNLCTVCTPTRHRPYELAGNRTVEHQRTQEGALLMALLPDVPFSSGEVVTGVAA